MPDKQPTTQKTSPRSWVDPRDQDSLWVLVSIGLVMTVCYWWYLGGHQGQLIEIERATPLEAKFLVDINRADWSELIQLPGLGETLAQRVLAQRRDNGPFREVEDLVRVEGIGIKTLKKIRPYLMPIPKDNDRAEAGRDTAPNEHKP